MAISYDDFKKKYGNQVDDWQKENFFKKNEISKSSKNSTERKSLSELKTISQSKKKEFNTSKSNLKKYLVDNDITTGNNTYSAPNLFTVRNRQMKDNLSGKAPLLSNKIGSERKDITRLPTVEQENVSKYNSAINSQEGKNLFKATARARNEDALAESNYQTQKGIEDYKNGNTITRIGKVLTSPLRGAASVLNLDNKRVYNDPETKTTYKLPTYSEGIDAGINQYGNGVAKTVNAVGTQMGKLGGSALLNSLMPGLGATAYNVDLFNNSYNEALRDGYDAKQAASYATLSTVTEFATGKILGAAVGRFSKSGDFEGLISKSLKKVLKNEKLNSVISSAISEGTEEFLQEFADVYTRNLTLGEDNKINSDTVISALYSGLIGALSSGSSEGIRQLTKGSIRSQIDQIVYDIEKVEGNTLSEVNKTRIANNVMEQYLSNNGPVNPKEVVNSFIKDIDDRVNNLKQSAENESIDIKKASGLINNLSKLIKDRGYNITFDSSIGSDVNGVNIDGNTIKINPNSTRAMEFIAIHEVTHSVSTDTMRDLVMDYVEKHPELNKTLDSLKETYKTKDISDEVLADFSGQLFGNQEFIKMLKNDEPSIFKKLYNGVISIANKLTGNTNETLFINDLKNKWENAYRSSLGNTFSEKYHLSENARIEVDDALNNPNTDNDSMVKLRDFTPKQLVDVGVNDLPMLVRKGHLRENILTETEAINKGFSIKGKHYHGLGMDTYMNAIDSLDNPVAVYQYTDSGKYSKDNFIILTEIKDSNGKNIIVPIEINKKGPYNHVMIDTNKIKTAYGKDNKYYFNNMVKNGDLKELYKKRNIILPVQSGNHNVSSASNIPQSNEDVKLPLPTSKYSMQENANNAGLDDSSFLINNKGAKIDISNLHETSYMKLFTFNRKYNRNSITAYRGINENGGTGVAMYGLGLYTTLDKNYASQYGNVNIVDSNLLPDNPLHFKTQNDFKIWEQELAKQLDVKRSELYSEDYGVEQYIKKLGYDGLMIGIGKDTDLISFKDVKVKYSKDSSDWQNALENNLPSKGTRTYGKDIKLPGIENKTISNESKSNLTATEIQELDDLKNSPFMLTVDEKNRMDYLENKSKEIKKDIVLPTDTKRKAKSKYESDAIKEKVEKKVRQNRFKAIIEATEAGNKQLNFTRQEKQQFKDDLDGYIGLSTSQLNEVSTFRKIKSIVERYANKELTFVDSELADIQKEIRGYRFKVDDNVKNSITDFKDFRKNNFGKIIFNKDGSSIDTIYQELSYKYPGYFDSDVYSQEEMLYRIEAVMNQDTEIIDSYRIDEESLTSATRDVIQKLQNKMMSEEDIENLQNEIEEKALARTREVVYQEYIDNMRITVEDLDTGKDINILDLSRTDPKRLFEKVFDKKVADKLNRELTEGVEHNEALKNNELTRLRDEVKSLGIKVGSKESAAVQKYVEGHYIDEYGDYREYNDHDLMSEFPKVNDQEKIKEAARWFREIYAMLGQTYNNTLMENGYKPIEMRKNYMPHFQEKGDILSRIGYPLSPQTLSEDVLPTDINGLTAEFKPGKKYFSHEQRRTGEKTIYDAIRGFDEYIEGWGNVVYHTEDIQKRRAIAKLVRDTYGPTNGTKNENFMGLARTQQINRIRDIQKHKLAKFAAWIDEQANFIAGKKGIVDRALEGRVGRKIYTIMRAGKKQVGSNMVGMNLRSPLTNFASTVQAFSKTNPIDTIRGYVSTIAQVFQKDDLVSKSDFLTNRLNPSERIYTKLWDKASNMGQLLMGATDSITTNMIYRSKYAECLRKGMKEKEAIRVSDDFTARIMGNRTIGTTASIFNDQTFGMFTQFQLELNNFWSSIIHDNKMALQDEKISLANKVGGMVWQAGSMIGLSYIFNNVMRNITGSDVMLDFVEMFKTIFAPDDDDEETSMLDRAQSVFQDIILDQLPFSSVFTGGRLPIGEAFKGGASFIKFLTGQEDEYGKKYSLKDTGEDMIDSALYWLLPTGYSQAKKTYKGLSMYDSKLPIAGSYTNSGNLRFTADSGNLAKAQAALFGQYAGKEAQEYIDSGYKTIHKNHIAEMKALGLKSSDYREYQAGLTNAGKKISDKVDYIYGLDNVSTAQKNIMAQNLYKKDTDASKEEEKKIKELNMSDNQLRDYYSIKASITVIRDDDSLSSEDKKTKISNEFLNSDLDDKQLAYLYSNYYSSEDKVERLVDLGVPIKDYIRLNSQTFESDYYLSNGKSVSGSKKKKVIEYVNSLKLSVPQKAILIKSMYNSYKDYDNQIINYVNKIDVSANEKKTLLKSIGFNNYDKDIIEYVNSQHISIEEKEKKLKDLGFTIRNGRVYTK